MRLNTLLLSLLFLTCVMTFNLYNKIEISNKTGAACLDGSNAAFYLWVPDQYDTPVNKVLIYFEETPFGWCVKEDLSTSLEECYKFLTESYLQEHASTNDWGGSFMILSGMLSITDGGDFGMWTKVLIKSCDAGAYMGNRDPIQFKKHKMHFKGSLNVQEVFKYLQKNKILDKRDEVVISGSTNGAIAALNWVDVLRQYTSAPIRLFLDSAIHLNVINHKTNRSEIENRMKMVQKLFLNDGAPPNQKCVAANKQEPWRCLFGLQLQKHLSYPAFYTQSLYDGWTLDYVLGFKCAEQFASLSECEEWERQAIQAYHKNVTAQMREIAKKPGNGVFGISCVAHQFVRGRWNNDWFEVPMESGNIVVNVTGKWLKSKNNTVYIDQVEWPHNKPCARKVISPKYSLKKQ